MSAQSKPRRRKCRAEGCGQWYTPYNSLEPWCSQPCRAKLALATFERRQAMKYRAVKKKEIARKRERVAAKKKFNEGDKTWCCKKAKEELHRWIVHVRDAEKPCISCGNQNPNIKYDAGHFLSVGAHKNLEMEPRNIHKQCSLNCNQHLSSNRAGYEAGIIERYGQEELDWLLGPHEPRRYRAHDYLEIRDKYRELNRAAGVLPYQNREY